MSTTYEESVAIPRVSLSSVLRYQSKVYPILQQRIGEVMNRDTLDTLTRELLGCFKPTAANLPAAVASAEVRQSCLWNVINDETGGINLGEDMAMFLAIRMAGNATAFREGYPLTPWRQQRTAEWVISEISEATRHITARKRMPGGMFTFRVLSGEPAGTEFEQFIPDFAAEKMAMKAGVRDRHVYRRMHPRELVRARVFTLMQPGSELRIDRYIVRDSMRQRNKHRMESREGKIGCIDETKYPCHFCPHGYTLCVNGTHQREYETRPCRKGHLGMKDPEGSKRDLCLTHEATGWWAAGNERG